MRKSFSQEVWVKGKLSLTRSSTPHSKYRVAQQKKFLMCPLSKRKKGRLMKIRVLLLSRLNAGLHESTNPRVVWESYTVGYVD
jgi:hypothetical protein